MPIPFLSLLLFPFFLSLSSAEISSLVGINYGQLGNNLPSPSHSVNLIKSLNAQIVKIYDANPQILNALKNTDLRVSVMVPNELIINISSNQNLADQWVRTNILPFYPQIKIRYLLVGNEIISSTANQTWFSLVPAMRRIKHSLKTYGIHKVKVGTSSAMDVLQSSFPPSNGTFREDIADRVMRPMLQFLNRTKSFYFLDVYPYFPWSSDSVNIKLDYALFESKNITYSDPVSGLVYTNLFDQMVDSVIFAMKRLGFPDIRVFIAETGWPNGGDYDQIGANIHNAAVYNRNIVKRMTSKPPVGTPARPGRVLPTIIFSLYNENEKGGSGTERHFGLLYPSGKAVYEMDLSGSTAETKFKPLPEAETNEPYKGRIWCVVGKGVNMSEVVGALSYACSQGNKTCEPIRKGGPCYEPDSLKTHASFAFSSYWAQFRKIGGTCYFNGLATQTIKDPSYGKCKFPSVTLQG
ncbi:LOW QUALITY PROTEIN: probable glucan endo-1,3-beta-glucosidase A6 [Cucumis melo]|uniref:glucan endo-1,3-beta-D-glucosidase n=1 Tax=Cucumis melo TaxID=3656 RepID=A0A1S3CCE3_CUCME|nr:LOW QUALITY PROTEIN: probable glucan endo-1,3-beta-glucosidase A6 [Cucumis melo]